jgi:hypothetical protein
MHRDREDRDLSRESCSVAGCSRRSTSRTIAPGLGGFQLNPPCAFFSTSYARSLSFFRDAILNILN